MHDLIGRSNMRCGIYSLAGLVRNELKQDPLELKSDDLS
jgi:hypothetical protein